MTFSLRGHLMGVVVGVDDAGDGGGGAEYVAAEDEESVDVGFAAGAVGN